MGVTINHYKDPYQPTSNNGKYCVSAKSRSYEFQVRTFPKKKLMNLGAVEIRWRVLPARLSSIGFIYHQWLGWNLLVEICCNRWNFANFSGSGWDEHKKTTLFKQLDTPKRSPFSGSINWFGWYFHWLLLILFLGSTFARVLMRVYREYLFGSKYIPLECVGFGMLRDLCIVDFHPCSVLLFHSYIWHTKLGSHLFNQHTDPTRSCHLAVFCFALLGWSWAKEWT